MIKIEVVETELKYKLNMPRYRLLQVLPLRLWIGWTCVSILSIIIFIIFGYVGKASWWDESLWGNVYENNYCEYVNLNGFFRQRANTISNLPFIIVGEFLLTLYIKDKKQWEIQEHNNNNNNNDNTTAMIYRYPIWTLIYGIILIYLGIGSILFHGSFLSLGQRLDVSAIYATTLFWLFIMTFQFIVSYYYVKLGKIGDSGNTGNISTMALSDQVRIKRSLIGLITAMVVLDIVIIFIKQLLVPIFYLVVPLCMFITVILCNIWYYKYGRINKNNINGLNRRECKISYAVGMIGVLIIGIGYIVGNQFDENYCKPRSLFQWHSVFHVTTCIGMFMLVIMFRLQTHNNRNDDNGDGEVPQANMIGKRGIMSNDIEQMYSV